MPLPLLANLAIGFVVSLLGSFLTLRGLDQGAEPETPELEAPTSDSNKPVVVVFGTMWIEDPNVLHTFGKGIRER